jgi:RimJ/RimL family protein N-acetyltransferase
VPIGPGCDDGPVLRPTYPIETKRLLLRPFEPGDAGAMYAYMSRDDVCRYLLHPPLTAGEVGERIGADRSELTEPGQSLLLAVVERDSGTLVGDVVLFWRSREHRAGEVGYVFNPDHGGRGYATEAGAAMLRLGFDELGLHRIEGRIDARNTASAKVLERLGMRREAHFVQNEFVKGEWADEVVYAVLAGEWRDPTQVRDWPRRGDRIRYRRRADEMIKTASHISGISPPPK